MLFCISKKSKKPMHTTELTFPVKAWICYSHKHRLFVFYINYIMLPFTCLHKKLKDLPAFYQQVTQDDLVEFFFRNLRAKAVCVKALCEEQWFSYSFPASIRAISAAAKQCRLREHTLIRCTSLLPPESLKSAETHQSTRRMEKNIQVWCKQSMKKFKFQ